MRFTWIVNSPHKVEDFGTLLRRQRRARGWSQKRLAWEAWLSPAYISTLESGRRPPPAGACLERLVAMVGGYAAAELRRAAFRYPPLGVPSGTSQAGYELLTALNEKLPRMSPEGLARIAAVLNEIEA
jgi:HTH-type transcriptional regulator, competence development regulator